MASAFDDDLSEELTKLRNPQPSSGVRPDTPVAPGAKRGWSGVLGDTLSTADDIARAGVDTLSFGLADRALEATGLEPGAIQKTVEARQRSPYTTIGGDVAGGLAGMAMTPLRAIGAGTAAALGGARAGLRGIAGRAAGYGAEGALVGAGQGAGHTYDWENATANIGHGGLYGGIGGAALGPLTPRASLAPRTRAEVPSPGDLGQATDTLYAAGRSNPANVHRTGEAVRSKVDEIKQSLYKEGWNEESAKTTFAGLDHVAKSQAAAAKQGGEAAFTPGNLESVRKSLNKATEKEDIKAAKHAKQMFDDFTANPTAEQLSSGTVAGAKATDAVFEAARGNAAANIRSRILRDAEETVDRASATRNSGRNYENNMRSKIASILASEGRSFPAAEREGLENLARRTDAWNTTREVGNMLGGGGGIGTWVAPLALGSAGGAGAAYATGDPTTTALSLAAPILAGRALRSASNRSMHRAVSEMDDIIRSNSPEFARRQAITPGIVTGPGTTSGTLATRDAVVESLLRREQDQQRPHITINPRPGYYR